MGKPKIRFKGFDNDWEQRKLSDIAVLTSSKRVHAEDYVETGVPFYRGKEISELKEHKPISEVLYITEYKYNEISSMYGSPKEGDLLITAVGTLGNTWVIDQTPFYFKDGNLIWFKDIKCNPKYLDYAMSTADGQKKILASAIGSNQKALTMVKLNELEFMFPGKAEQDKIAENFSYLDNLITLHQRKCEETKKMKKYMLQKMFPQNGSKVPEIRFKGFTDDWEQRKLGEICSRIQGNDGRMELPTLTISAGNGWMKQEDRFSGNIAGKEQKNYTLLKKGELSYNHGNSKLAKYGTVFSLQTYEEALVPRVYHSFKIENGNANFIEYYFATKLPDRELGKLISSGARMDGLLNIGYDDFMSISLLLPKTQEQNHIAGYFRIFDQLITLHHRKLICVKNALKFTQNDIIREKL